MANRMNRYKALAQKIRKSDTASTFPRHVFLKAANAKPDEDHNITPR